MAVKCKKKKNVRNEIDIKFYEVKMQEYFFNVTLTRDWNRSVKKYICFYRFHALYQEYHVSQCSIALLNWVTWDSMNFIMNLIDILPYVFGWEISPGDVSDVKFCITANFSGVLYQESVFLFSYTWSELYNII